jgi:hypothetical protein
MQIYIHRNNEDFGPYSKEAVLEYLKQGVFQACDYACYQGMSEWKTVSDLLGIAPAPDKSGKGGKGGKGAIPAAARQGARTGSIAMPAPAAMRRSPAPPANRTGIILLNILLAALVCGGIYLRMGGGGEAGRQLMAGIRGAILGQPAATPLPSPCLLPIPCRSSRHCPWRSSPHPPRLRCPPQSASPCPSSFPP